MITRIVEGADGARDASGVVVVVDVMRAFTTAAYAFAAGASEIDLVATVEEAMEIPGFRMGEVGGRLIEGFDHNNSPSRLAGRRLDGRRAIMRTGSGTRCVAAATGASEIWLGSFVVASATVRALAGRGEVTFVVSGAPHEGEEDIACAELMAARLEDGAFSIETAIATVRNSRAAHRHLVNDADFPAEDVACATAVDAFDFAMRAEWSGRRWTARRFPPVDG